ncbi:MAG TPA: TonB family protein [Xanthobacteraceae bacterium]|jgi:protein TonB|nr:TonB family protein [Xanthobacteraceae bacterium]
MTLDREGSRHQSRAIWALAALGALALHAGGAAVALGALQSSDTDDDLGAPAIEIGVELTSPQLDATNLPVGPDTEASAPSPEVIEQKEVVQQTDLPKAIPTETDDPDRVVSPNDTQKPVKEDQKEATAQADPSEASSAAEQTAVPTVENAQQSTGSVAPSPGTGASAVRQRATWEKELAAHFNKFKRYPADRIMKNAEVVVGFVLDRVGHVLSSRIVKGSGDASFDAAALAMLQRSDPVPPPPPVVADENLSFTVPVDFRVKPQN